MRDWLQTATDCSCPTLDVCGLFERDGGQAAQPESPEPLRITHVGRIGAVA